MDSKGKKTLALGLGAGAVLLLVAANVLENKNRYATAEPESTRPPPVTPAAPPPATAAKVEPPAAKEVAEIDKPGSKEFLALLKSARLFHTLVVDFAHQELSPDRITVVVADEYQDGPKGLRRDIAKKLQVVWSMARAAEQPDPTKCTVLISSRAGRVLAHSDYGGRGDVIVLREDE